MVMQKLTVAGRAQETLRTKKRQWPSWWYLQSQESFLGGQEGLSLEMRPAALRRGGGVLTDACAYCRMVMEDHAAITMIIFGPQEFAFFAGKEELQFRAQNLVSKFQTLSSVTWWSWYRHQRDATPFAHTRGDAYETDIMQGYTPFSAPNAGRIQNTARI